MKHKVKSSESTTFSAFLKIIKTLLWHKVASIRKDTTTDLSLATKEVFGKKTKLANFNTEQLRNARQM
jgi:membrane protein implicated in regulation of membrane protease activity